jgi:hypothetical protein
MRLLLAVMVFVAAAPDTEVDLPPVLASFLKKGKWDATPRAFRVIALSHLADGCAQEGVAEPLKRESAQKCVARALTLARATLPGPVASLQDGLWLTHLDLVLGASDRVGPCADAALHESLSRRLAAMSLKDAHAHVASYATTPLRWPADQAATLAALGRFDAAHGTHLVAAPLEAWRRVLVEKGMNSEWKLPVSEVTGRGPGAQHPRGCAQSYISRYLAEVDPALSAEWWLAYREGFLTRVAGVPGFREWPPGVEGVADADSGPILLGIGAAASAFGIAAARAQGDAALAVQLESAADLVLSTGAGGGAAKTVLAEAIRYQARTQPQLVP